MRARHLDNFFRVDSLLAPHYNGFTDELRPKRRNNPLKTPTSAELAFLRRRAEQTFQRMPVFPRREDGRMTPESRLRFELSMESILENNRTLGACVVLRRPSGQYDVFCHGTARLSAACP